MGKLILTVQAVIKEDDGSILVPRSSFAPDPDAVMDGFINSGYSVDSMEVVDLNDLAHGRPHVTKHSPRSSGPTELKYDLAEISDPYTEPYGD